MGRRLSAGGAATLLSALVVLGLVAPTAQGAGDEAGTVSGTVFQDYDSDGVLDPAPTGPDAGALPRDRGLAGVTVTAYDADEDVVGTTVSGPDGSYVLDVAGARTSQLRLQYTGLPQGYWPSFSVREGDAGADPASGSNVQLVDIGATGVTFGVNAPDEYAAAGPDTPVVAAIHYSGAHDEPQVAGSPSLVTYPWLTGPTSSGSAPAFNEGDLAESRTVLASVGETGVLWGMAAQRSTGDVFASAVLKRHVGLGPLGLGGIYRVPGVTDPATGLLATPGPAEAWFDLDGQGDVDLNPDGLDLSDAGRGLGAFNTATPDAVAYDAVGTVGLGGMAVSSDQSTLYVLNLTQKRLELVDISGPTPAYLGSQDLGLGPDDRPWGVDVLRGRVYVGYVENASAGEQPPPGDAPVPDDATFVAQSRAVVRAADEADLAALGGPGSEVLGFGLDFQRGLVWGSGCPDPANGERVSRFCHWHPWTQPQGGGTFVFGPDLMGISAPATAGLGWAQPIVSSFALAPDGSLVVGMQDRFSLQIGNFNQGPDGSTLLVGYEGYSQGDLLAAAPLADGTYALESDGVVGGTTGAGSGTLEGPGGGEFFDDVNVFATPDTRVHHEMTTGALITLPGADQVLSSGYDTGQQFRTNGFAWFSTGTEATGSAQRGRIVSDETLAGSLQKAGGLSDVAAILAEAPLQIGNVAWFDADQDGVQDADEPPVPGVTVRLLGPGGDELATTTTDVNGQYSFSTVDVDGFDPRGGDYEVAFVLPTTGNLFEADPRFGTVPWSAVAFTTPDADSAGVDPDAVDSDAVVGDDPATGTVAYTAGGPGENDPDLDAGLVAFTVVELVKELAEESREPEPGQEFTLLVEARDFRGDAVDLGDDATVTLPVGGSQEITGLPVGTQLQVTEDVDPGLVSYVVDPAGWFLVGSTDVEGRVVTVTNTLLDGGFTVEKVVTDPGGTVPEDTVFTVEYTVDGGDPVTAEIGVDEPLVVEDLPAGAEVEVTEVDLPGDVEWTEPVWSSDAPGVTVDGAGATFVVVAGAEPAIALVLTNAVVPPPTPPTPPGPPGLPQTGADVLLVAGAALLLLLAGGTTVVLVRRRRA